MFLLSDINTINFSRKRGSKNKLIKRLLYNPLTTAGVSTLAGGVHYAMSHRDNSKLGKISKGLGLATIGIGNTAAVIQARRNVKQGRKWHNSYDYLR